MIIKAGICVAYDWEFLKQSLPAIYSYVDQVCLSVDKERRSWSGNLFEIDWLGFNELVRSIDTEGKISILEESFYDKGRTPILNECYQRKSMVDHLGPADWYVQIDTDEMLINTPDFVEELKKYSRVKRAINIHGVWINLIKQVEGGFVYSIQRTPPIATNRPVYEYGRTNGHFNVYEDFFLAHITWARPEQEVAFKLSNWGHSKECSPDSFFKLWKAIDNKNWVYIKNFHPMVAPDVLELYFAPAQNLEELIQSDFYFRNRIKKKYLQNNIWASRIKKLLGL